MQRNYGLSLPELIRCRSVRNFPQLAVPSLCGRCSAKLSLRRSSSPTDAGIPEEGVPSGGWYRYRNRIYWATV